ncbi:nitroreductase family protein [Mangrovibacterium sp.]|uniref:nitroreductase family protein n=1 Tax=Mangrovibacterium sp. TaxID=1961364 RepID=UPI0035624BF9
MLINDLIYRNRSYRRFDESVRISEQQLIDWIGLARFSASARNAQPLKFVPLWEKERCDKLFPLLGWAGYLKDWNGPKSGERPSAYILMLNDTDITTNYFCDDGIAAQSILLGAVEAGFGGCMIASVKKEKLRELFQIPDRFQILMVLAIGKPVEEVVIENIKDGGYKYWRDEQGVHHVPKRSLDELILKL